MGERYEDDEGRCSECGRPVASVLDPESMVPGQPARVVGLVERDEYHEAVWDRPHKCPPSDPLRNHCDLPPDAVPLSVVEVVEYLTTDGSRAFVVRHSTGNPLSTIVGLLELGKAQVLEDSREWNR